MFVATLDMVWSLVTGRTNAQTQEQKKDNLKNLTLDELNCYKTIVKSFFLLCSKPRVEFSSKADSNGTYSIKFLQSKSWTTVQTDLLSVDATNPTLKAWAHQWKLLIGRLKGQQDDIIKTARLMLMLRQKIAQSGELKIDIDFNDPNAVKTYYSNLATTLKDTRSQVIKALEVAERALEIHLKTPTLNKDPTCLKIMNFIHENWSYLTVFSLCPEVPMDVEKLFVQVITAKNPITITEKGVAIDIDPIGKNLSTKAIFQIKAEEIQERIIYKKLKSGGEGGTTKFIVTKKLDVTNETYGTSPKLPKRSVQLTDEIFYGYTIHDEADTSPQPKIKVETTAMADRLHLIVKLALEEVNRLLGDQFALSEKTETVRYDVFYKYSKNDEDEKGKNP